MAIKECLRLDERRRQHLYSNGAGGYLFQSLVNYHTLEFDKPLSMRMVWNIVACCGCWGGVEKLTPYDLRRTAIARALDQGLNYRRTDDERAP